MMATETQKNGIYQNRKKIIEVPAQKSGYISVFRGRGWGGSNPSHIWTMSVGAFQINTGSKK
jgi:hypothetical protein